MRGSPSCGSMASRSGCSHRTRSRSRLFRALDGAGLTCRTGEPFHCVSATAGPRSAIDVLTTLYRLAFGSVITAAADDGPGGLEIVPYVDLPLGGTGRASAAPLTPRAWLEAIVQQIGLGREAQTALTRRVKSS